jgi:lipopolysaccharide export system protein LptA
MHISIEKLRSWLLIAVAAVAVVIVGYLAVARYQRWRSPAERIVPLAEGILQQTNGFTYSKSNQGRTLFTIHAARAVQLQQAGQAELYDVVITLYGRMKDREDRIAGNEFHYDQNTGVATAKGEVLLDLQAPSGEVAETAKSDKGIIHVKTQGLVFVQKLGMAATDQPLQFTFSGVTGTALGAEYDSDQGLLTLQSTVEAHLQLHGQPLTITATHAVIDHTSGETRLTQVDAHSAVQTAHADTVTVHSRPDSSIDHIDANGTVTVSSEDYGNVVAPMMQMWMDTKNQPVRASATGGIHYTDQEAMLQRTGEAADGEATFGAKGALHTVNLNGDVKMHERAEYANSSAAPKGKMMPITLERNATAAHMVLGFGAGAKGKSVLKTMHTEGEAHVVMQQASTAKTPGANAIATREISGDVLDGDLSTSNGKTHFSHIQSSGHTRVVQTAADGGVETSTGDTLNAVMRPQQGVEAAHQDAQRQPHQKSPPMAVEIVSAVQVGHVHLMQSTPPTTNPATKQPGNPSQPAITTGQGDRAEYNGDQQRLVLTGNAQVTDAGTTLWAQRITLDQQTDNVLAEGAVKGNYQQADSANSEPVHVIADHAQLLRAEQRAIFYGRPGADARLWQQASQVSAPVLDILHSTQTLTAHGDGSAAMPVHAVFPADRMKSGSANQKPAAGTGGVVRVASHEMVYSDTTHTAIFNGGVDVSNNDGNTQAHQATVWLQNGKAAPQTGAAKNAAQPALLGGNVQRIQAEGAVVLQQPGRRGYGDTLVYTAQDGHYLLTGTPGAPPKLIDDVKGTVTGASLLFESNDDTVIVSSGPGYNRPHVDTHAK